MTKPHRFFLHLSHVSLLEKPPTLFSTEVHVKREKQHHVHAAAPDCESKKTLARPISFSLYRLAQNMSVLLLIVPPCSRQEQTTVCERDTDMVSPGSH